MGHYGTGSAVGPSAPASLEMSQGEGDEYSDDGDVGEGESEGVPQTAAERLASRRKMKRFRYSAPTKACYCLSTNRDQIVTPTDTFLDE